MGQLTELSITRPGESEGIELQETKQQSVPPSVSSTLSNESPGATPAAAAAASSSAKGTNSVLDAEAKQNMRLAYLDYNTHLKSVWRDVPDLLITYNNLSFTVPMPVQQTHITTLGTALYYNFKPVEKKPFHALNNVSGAIRPGTMTLILAPPGHGKSLFLKALANKLDSHQFKSGDIHYNGQTSEQALHAGIHVSKMVNYVEQQDVHMPLLTVRETFEFALKNAVPDPALLNDPKLIELHNKKVDAVIELLGLKECENTIVGNAMNRGVSGGQKKRVTLGEFIVGNARALFLDEISTGLDAAATFDITAALRRWARLMNGSAVVALLQPAPEVYDMFDDIILMREGCIMYHGPRAELMPYLDREFGIHCPSDQDEADFLTEFLTDPLKIARRQLARQKHAAKQDAKKRASQVDSQPPPYDNEQAHPSYQKSRSDTDKEKEPSQVHFHESPSSPHSVKVESASTPAPLPVTYEEKTQQLIDDKMDKALVLDTQVKDLSIMHTRAMAQIWEKSTVCQAQRDNTPGVSKYDPSTWSDYSKAQYGSPFPRSLWYHTVLNLTRQMTLVSRDKGYIGPRIGQSIFMGLVLGSLFYQLGICDFYNRIGLVLFAAIFGGFSNMPELPIAVEARQVVTKQTQAGFYSTFSYVFSVVLMHVPLAATEAAVLSIILYFMTGFTTDAGRFFFFYLGMFASNMSISVFYRMIAYSTPNPDVANQMAGPTTAVFLLFGGFLITYNKIPNFMQWLYWLSPFSWIVKSLSQNEFFAPRYTVLSNNGLSCAATTDPPNTAAHVLDLGSSFLTNFQISTDTGYKWGGIGYLFGFFAFFTICSALVLKYKRVEIVNGTRRSEDDEDALIAQQAADAARSKDKDVVMNSTPVDGKATESSAFLDSSAIMVASGAASALPFEPCTLAFTHLHYTVKVKKDGKTVDRKLLEDVSGYAKPGTLTALMGSSGAGKTTLMDVVAGRKTAGKIEGSILVNGYPKNDGTFSRVSGYVEQTDVHTPTDTVREALMFSAKLRLPESVSEEQRIAFVDEVLHILELDQLAERLVGDESIPGLSPGQMKRLTIGVELVANPSILFLDEPTSGLDSRAALVVMRVIKRIASTGRSVVCTIHQPSAELFYMFDRLLLLKSGGKEVFFGDIGEEGSELVHYFETIEGANSPKKPPRANPASWILDVIGAGVMKNTERVVDHAALYAASPLKSTNTKEIEQACQPTSTSKQLSFDSRYARSYLYQWWAVQIRFYTFHWRNVPFNLTRMSLLGFLGVLFGLVYLNLRVDDYAGVNSKIAVMYMTSAFNGVLHSATALPVLIRQRAVFYREKASYTYTPFAYSTSLAFVEIPYVLFACFLFVIPYYFMVGFPSDARLFFEYLFFHFLLSLNFCYAGQMIAGLFPNMLVANIMQGLMFTFLFLFGGVFIRPPDIPKGWIWMYYINPVPKSLIGMAASQFECRSDGSGYGCYYITDPTTGNQQVRVDTFVQTALDFGYDVKWAMAGWLILTLFVFRFLVALVVSKVSHVTR